MHTQVEFGPANEVNTVLAEIFDDLAADIWSEPLDLSPNRSLIDLGIESISLVYLLSELQQHFGLGDRLFRMLRDEDRLLRDMTVGDVVSAVVELRGHSAAEAAE